MTYLVERPDTHLSRVEANQNGSPSSLEQLAREQLAHDLAHVHVEGWRQAYGSLLPEQFYNNDARTSRVHMWTSLLADEAAHSRVRIATTDTNDVVGFSIHGPARDEDRDGIELFALYILEDHYGSGVGQRLLDASIGAEPACLWVTAGNPRAIRFYERNGFQPDGTRKTDPEVDGLDEMRLVRERR